MHAFTPLSAGFTDTLSGTTMFGTAGGPGFASAATRRFPRRRRQSVAAGMDIAVSPKLLTDWRIGYYRYTFGDHKYDQSTELRTNSVFRY